MDRTVEKSPSVLAFCRAERSSSSLRGAMKDMLNSRG